MSNFIDVHISNLRKKISGPDQEQIITTVRGFGYRVERGSN
jgi:DNA-binding response OmpR family regulator